MSLQNKKILFADDDLDDRELMEEALLQINKDLLHIAASSGREALDFLMNAPDTDPISLILLDFNMPDLTGAQVCERIVKVPRYRETPKIIWSTSDSSLYQHISEASGADYYFQKPQRYELMVELLRHILSLSERTV